MNESFILCIHATARVVVILTATFAISKNIHPTRVTPSPVSVLGIVDVASVPHFAIITPTGVIIRTCITPYSSIIYHSEVIIYTSDCFATLTYSDTFVAEYITVACCFSFIAYAPTATYATKDFFIFHIVSSHKLLYEFHTVGSA
jgi:hypothetical protein